MLCHLFPAADIPVLQLSIDRNASLQQHARLGARLAPVRERGVLILGSGNIVHNLGHAFGAWRAGETATPAWAQRFDTDVAQALQQPVRSDAVIATLNSADANLAHPAPEHFLPLVYAAAASDARDTVEFPVDGFDMASLSMRSVRFQPAAD